MLERFLSYWRGHTGSQPGLETRGMGCFVVKVRGGGIGVVMGKAELEPARGAQAIEGEVQGRCCVRQGIVGREKRLVDPVSQLQW